MANKQSFNFGSPYIPNVFLSSSSELLPVTVTVAYGVTLLTKGPCISQCMYIIVYYSIVSLFPKSRPLPFDAFQTICPQLPRKYSSLPRKQINNKFAPLIQKHRKLGTVHECFILLD